VVLLNFFYKKLLNIKTYSISDLEKFTGIKRHTIRTWEQRYNLLIPKRKESNIRYYNDDQLRMLLNVSLLLSSGMKISSVSRMTNQEIYDKIDEIVKVPEVENLFDQNIINQLVHAGLTMNEFQFEKSISSALIRYGFKKTYVKVIYPLLIRIGLMWGKEKMNAAQEHFISNLLRQKILVSIDALPYPQTNKERWVLFLPQNESHEIGLLFAHYLIKESGRPVIYLGQNVPLENLISVAETVKSTHLYCFFVKNIPGKFCQNLLNQLEQLIPKNNILVSGNSRMLGSLELAKHSTWVQSIEQLQDDFLTPFNNNDN